MKLQTGYVYKLTNLPTGRVYIGSTFDIDLRIATHYSQLEKGEHYNAGMQLEYSEHKDSENLVWEVLHKAPLIGKYGLRELETYFIQSHSKEELYNIEKNPLRSIVEQWAVHLKKPVRFAKPKAKAKKKNNKKGYKAPKMVGAKKTWV